MSTVIRRMPRLAARGLAVLARTSTAAAAAPRAPAAARFAPLSSRPGWLQQADWRQSFRRFSAAAEPEGAEAPAPAAEEPTVDDVVAADAEPAAAADAELAEDQAVPEAESNNKLFVFNLSWGVDDEALADVFSRYGGVVSARVARKREDGSSMGFGFVELESGEAAAAALAELEGSNLQGRTLRIRYNDGGEAGRSGGRARTREQRPGSDRGRQQNEQWSKVVVHGLPFNFEWQDFKDLAQRALESGGASGEAVRRADVRRRPDNTSRGWGMLHLSSPEDADLAVKMLHGSTLDGRTLSAKLDEFAGGSGGYREPRERRYRRNDEWGQDE